MSWLWPAGPRKAGGVGGAAAPADPLPALTPTLYGPLAQWALDAGMAPLGERTDRSGAGHSLSNSPSVVRPCPDIRPYPARSVVWPGIQGGNNFACNGLTADDFAGPCTFTAKVWYRPADFAGGAASEQLILGSGDLGGTLSTWWLYVDTAGVLCSYWSGSTDVISALPVVGGSWVWVSMQRDAGNVVRLGVDGVHYTSTARPAQVPSAKPVCVGAHSFTTFFSWFGGISDVSLWNKRLSNAELEGLRSVAMGL